MAISEKDHLEFMRMTSEALGRIEANQGNTLRYLDAVNENQKETKASLEFHARDENAHGRASRGEVWGSIGKLIVTASALGAIIGLIVRLVWHTSP